MDGSPYGDLLFMEIVRGQITGFLYRALGAISAHSRPEFGLVRRFQSVRIGSPNIFPNTCKAFSSRTTPPLARAGDRNAGQSRRRSRVRAPSLPSRFAGILARARSSDSLGTPRLSRTVTTRELRGGGRVPPRRRELSVRSTTSVYGGWRQRKPRARGLGTPPPPLRAPRRRP